MILLEMMNEDVNISNQFGWIYSVKSNDIKEINSMDIVRCCGSLIRGSTENFV